MNSRLLARHGITEDTPAPVPGLSYYEKKDGRLTGYIIECSAEIPIILDTSINLTDEQIDAALNENPNPPAMLGRLEENVLGMRK